MSDRQLSLALAWLIPLIFTMIGPYSVNDLAVWITHGNYLLDHGELLRKDIFSVLPTIPLVYPAWGICFIYALIYKVGGLLSVCVFHSFTLSLILWLIYRDSLLQIENPARRDVRWVTFIFWLGAVAAFGERPSTIAIIPFLLVYRQLDQLKTLGQINTPWIARLIALNVLWVNIHGSYILLWMMFAWTTTFLLIHEKTYTKRSVLLRLLSIHLLIGVSALLNPFGFNVYPYILDTVFNSRGRISEFARTTPFAHFPTGFLYFFILGGAIAWLGFRWKKPERWKWIASPFFLILLNGLTAIRNAALVFMVLLPAAYRFGVIRRPTPSPEVDIPRKLNRAIFVVFCALLIAVSPWVKPTIASYLPEHRREVFDYTAPFRITEAIRKTNKTCAIFNHWELGSFLMLNLPNPIFLDARNIIFREQDFQAYLNATEAKPGWREFLSQHDACFAILSSDEHAPLVEALKRDGSWRPVMEEKGMVLFERLGS